MGTATHDGDLALILPALEEIHREFAGWVAFDLIGFVQDLAPPAWMRRVAPSPHAGRSYPGFVQWITSAGPWDIGLAPLADTAFNACKSGIKALDYAALGLAVLASDVPAYRGGLASGPNGGLVANTTLDWYRALSRAIRDRAWRRTLGEGAARHLRESGTLAARADAWRAAWADVARRPVRGR
jgi:glycosyltransferase involved in cell wall biosynthesis